MTLTPTGRVQKKVGDTLVVKLLKDASGDAKVSWTKVNGIRPGGVGGGWGLIRGKREWKIEGGGNGKK